ncbi:DUF4843 domain-containing protein [Pedobacter frigoris]|uniref:DUF4843 domain-containing protein n=1 Tax=Pedobacter frigoris TaxID=2571272 RepID=A0A4U1CJ22_9SPHI|nr:DUF4843 domain-containing protein [Pedobacter frigoris]TKC07437.1 DUF4843 domain-containing protein [Pedobacter frigoris]
MKALKYVIVAMVVLAFASCKKDQYYLYDDVARIQFGPENSRIYITSYNLADTLKPYTFFYEDASVTQDTVFFDIYAIGGVSKTDRTFTLEQEQVAGATNAISGTQYVAFNDPKATKNFVIKGGTVHTRVPIVLLRDASLKTSTPVLKFKAVADGNFQLGEINNLWRKIVFTDRLSQPAAWNASATQYYFGAYSVAKHQFMIDSTGEKWDQDFITSIMADYALLQYWTGTLKISLIDYNNSHPGNPLKAENGEMVVFP